MECPSFCTVTIVASYRIANLVPLTSHRGVGSSAHSVGCLRCCIDIMSGLGISHQRQIATLDDPPFLSSNSVCALGVIRFYTTKGKSF